MFQIAAKGKDGACAVGKKLRPARIGPRRTPVSRMPGQCAACAAVSYKHIRAHETDSYIVWR
ncbi:hypothetical protein K6W61_35345, partial [Burkholderia contaminans]|uniref:hypothetical protein n=1 Tax=Burkholderia contaminans TaxID=488447 RepID=UPI001C98B6D7